ncbi:MAG TPA: site-2 protease family protein [Micropepsaceae bacterium]|nr:site-2 protease family protein [Micropepsaceae bacterium]
MTSDALTQIILYAIPVILAVTFHEAAHGFVALYFGDETAKNQGRVTLNPIKHVDLFGTIILPLLLIVSNAGFIFGYAKPVPVNFAQLRNPRWDMLWVAAAGPAMNMLLALVSALSLYGAGLLDGEVAALVGNVLLFSIQLNVMLAIFNMLPLPPLDGSKVIAAFLPMSVMRPYLAFGRYGMTVLLLLLIVLPLLSARTGFGLDIFGVLVQRPAEVVMALLLTLVGRG